MGFIDRLKEKLTRKKLPGAEVPEKIVNDFIEIAQDEEIVTRVAENQDISKKKAQITLITDMIKENPELLGEIRAIINKDETLVEPLAEAAVHISKNEKVPDDFAVKIISKLPDEKAEVAIKEADLSMEDQVRAISTLKDDEKKENQIYNLLESLYKECDTMKSLEIEEKINKIVGVFKRTEIVNEVIYKIMAKNMANSYYKHRGGIIIGPLERVVPPAEMLRAELVDKMEEEYNKLLKGGEESIFDKDDIKRKLLEDSAKEVVTLAKKNDRPETSYVSHMGNLTDQEQEYFMLQLKKQKGILEGQNANENGEIPGKKLTGREESIITNKLNNINVNESEIEEINLKLTEISYEAVQSIASLTIEQMEIIKEIVESGLINSLENEEEPKRVKFLAGVTEILNNRKIDIQRREDATKQEEIEEEER